MPPYLTYFFSVKAERFVSFKEASQQILLCNSLNKPKTALPKTTALSLTVYHHNLPRNTELNHYNEICHSWKWLSPILEQQSRGLVGLKSGLSVTKNLMGCLNNATIPDNGRK